jgi:hypothetical protein
MMMAFKKYAYYMRGNKIAIVESASRSSSGFKAVAHCTVGSHTTKDTCEAAGGQWIPSSGGSSIGSFEEWQSPLETIADGLEIEYAYSPTYWVSDELRTQQNRFYLDGWTVVDGYLAFIKSRLDGGINWTASPYSAVGVDEYILIKNSYKWNGTHKIKSRDTYGLLITYTKVNETVKGITASSNMNIANEADGKAKIHANNSSNIWLGSTFSAGDKIIINNTTAINCGLWEIESVVTDTGADEESEQYMFIKNKYYHPIDLDEGEGVTSMSTQLIDTTASTSAHNSNSMGIYEAFVDPCYLISDVNVMEDESFDLDINPYLGKALVYYVKAKYAEDQMNIEAKEYFMREFYKIIDKHDSSRTSAVRQIQAPRAGVR